MFRINSVITVLQRFKISYAHEISPLMLMNCPDCQNVFKKFFKFSVNFNFTDTIASQVHA